MSKKTVVFFYKSTFRISHLSQQAVPSDWSTTSTAYEHGNGNSNAIKKIYSWNSK
jgi:hypothetical protein